MQVNFRQKLKKYIYLQKQVRKNQEKKTHFS